MELRIQAKEVGELQSLGGESAGLGPLFGPSLEQRPGCRLSMGGGDAR